MADHRLSHAALEEDPLHSSGSSRPKAQALFQCGLGRLRLGDIRGAYEDFKEAARIEPQNWEIWQKYEETYRAVESEVEEELAQCPQRHRLQTAMQRQTLARPRPPQHFTLQRPSEALVDLQALQRRREGSLAGEEEGKEEGAVDVKARLLRPAHRPRARSAEEGEAHDLAADTPSASSSASRAGDVSIELSIGTNWKYMVIHLSWLLSWIVVIYHYHFQKDFRTVGATLEVLLGTGFLVLVAWLAWWYRKRKTAITLSLTDGLKLISLVVIVIITVCHYCRADD